MPITVTCPTCGHEYHLSSKLGGKTLRCKLCQGAVTCPVAKPGAAGDSVDLLAVAAAPAAASASTRRPARRPAPSAPEQTLAEPETPATPRRLSAPPSKDRLLAGRICFVVTGLGYFYAILFGIAAMALRPDNMYRDASTFYTIIALAICAAVVAFSSVYLVCGILIRKGGHASVIIALILGSLHFLLLLTASVLSVLAALMNGVNTTGAIQVVLLVLYTAAVGQLIHYLIKILRQPRPA
jgi:hypothetical protein